MYLNQAQVDQLAANAVDAYEMSADWTNVLDSIREDITETFGFKPRNSLVLVVRKVAQLKWRSRVASVKFQIEGGAA